MPSDSLEAEAIRQAGPWAETLTHGFRFHRIREVVERPTHTTTHFECGNFSFYVDWVPVARVLAEPDRICPRCAPRLAS